MSRIVELFADRADLLFVALVALEITAICLLGLLAIRLAKRDAATRYALGLACSILMALCVPATWFLQSGGWSTFAWSRTVFLEASSEAVASEALLPTPVPTWIWLWLIGAFFVVLRMALGAWRVGVQRARAVPVRRLDGDAPVFATESAGPAVVGAFRPAVLIPQQVLDCLDEDEVQAVLAHEFAHVAHRHLLVALLQRVLAALFWPHPLVHLLNRQIVLAREEVCDNAVLRSAGAARYARVLLRVAECRQWPRQFSASVGLFGPPTQLEERVKSLLDPNRRIDPKMNKRMVFMACSALLMGMVSVAGARIRTYAIPIPDGSKVAVTAPRSTKASRNGVDVLQLRKHKAKSRSSARALSIRKALPRQTGASAFPRSSVPGLPAMATPVAIAPYKTQLSGSAVPSVAPSKTQLPRAVSPARRVPGMPGQAGTSPALAMPTPQAPGTTLPAAIPGIPAKIGQKARGRAGQLAPAMPDAPGKGAAYPAPAAPGTTVAGSSAPAVAYPSRPSAPAGGAPTVEFPTAVAGGSPSVPALAMPVPDKVQTTTPARKAIRRIAISPSPVIQRKPMVTRAVAKPRVTKLRRVAPTKTRVRLKLRAAKSTTP